MGIKAITRRNDAVAATRHFFMVDTIDVIL